MQIYFYVSKKFFLKHSIIQPPVHPLHTQLDEMHTPGALLREWINFNPSMDK